MGREEVKVNIRLKKGKGRSIVTVKLPFTTTVAALWPDHALTADLSLPRIFAANQRRNRGKGANG